MSVLMNERRQSSLLFGVRTVPMHTRSLSLLDY